MTIQALWNLQHGVPENKLYSGTNYTADSQLDKYVIARVKMRDSIKLIIDEKNQEEYENQVAKNIAKKIDVELSKLFK